MNPGQFAKVISKLSHAAASSAGGDTRVRRRQTGAGPGNVPGSCHSAPEWPDTWTASRKCARPPSAGRDICAPLWGSALPLCGAGAECSGVAPGRACPWACHSPYPATNAEYVSASARARHDHGVQGLLQQLIIIHVRRGHARQPAAHRPHPSPGSFSSHFSRDRWDWDQQRPPNRALPNIQSAACHFHCTPLSSSHSRTRRAHNFLNSPDFAPMLKAAMDRAVVAIHARNMVPLTAGAQVKDDPIQDPSPIYPLPARPRRWIKPVQQRFNPFPQFIRNFPQRGRCAFALGHRSLPSRNRRPLSPNLSFEMDSLILTRKSAF